MSSVLSKTKSVLVADTGPLLALARIDQLCLLSLLFKECQVTQSVVNECLAKPDFDDAISIQQALHSGQLVAVPDPKVRSSLTNLDAGEQTAVEKALSANFLLLIDEKRGRQIAQNLGLTVIGTLGILLAAKKAGQVSDVKPHLQKLQQTYYFSDTLLQHALELADE